MNTRSTGGCGDGLRSRLVRGQDMHAIPYEVFTTCRRRDLNTLRYAIKGLEIHFKPQRIIVATAHQNFPVFRRLLGKAARLVDEDTLVPGMTLDAIRHLQIEGFPRSAGWYFQQLLKYAWSFYNPDCEHYLIWDADTVPLRSVDFFDQSGSVLMAPASEYHHPYFDTFERLFGFPAAYEFSFISQHQMVNKSLLREMLHSIATRFPQSQNWAWAILEALPSRGFNLFSEYETYGHWLKHFYPDRLKPREVPWLREGTELLGYPPRRDKLKKFAEQYAFVAFEYRTRPMKKILDRVLAGYHTLRDKSRLRIGI